MIQYAGYAPKTEKICKHFTRECLHIFSREKNTIFYFKYEVKLEKLKLVFLHDHHLQIYVQNLNLNDKLTRLVCIYVIKLYMDNFIFQKSILMLRIY